MYFSGKIRIIYNSDYLQQLAKSHKDAIVTSRKGLPELLPTAPCLFLGQPAV